MVKRLRQQRRIQAWLRWMVLGCILPSVAMAAFLILHSYQRERASLEETTIARTRTVMQAVDRELISVQQSLQMLAVSTALQSGDLARFRARALAIVETRIFNAVILSDASGQQLVNTIAAIDETLPRQSNVALIKQVIETGKPAVSDLHYGAVSHRLLISVVVPVLVQGKPVLALTGGLYPDGLDEMLQRQHEPSGWIMGILDSTGTIVARSSNSERFVGQKAVSDLLHRIAASPEGVMDTLNRDGVPTFVSFSRSAFSGWSVAIGIPAADLTSDMHSSLWLSIAVASGLVILGLLWSQSIGASISRSIESLKAPALELASDHGAVMPEFIGVTEVSEVGDALIRTSRLLDQRAAERAAAHAELQAVAHRLTERSAELERSNADLVQFAYVASHDLKAPLRAIEHLVTWISEDIAPSANPDTASNLGLLQGRVARLQALLDGLLRYAQIGQSQMPMETIDVAAMVRDIVGSLAPPPGFVVECVGPMPAIRTHRIPLERVLENLIANALKHHDRRDGRVSVVMGLVDGVAEFCISDDGPGISPQFHERIFIIFQTLASRDDVESSGIGLAIVKRKVEDHGGRIWVESAPPERGSRFVFTWRADIG